MVAVERNVFMRNFPVLSTKVYEGTLTRSDVIGPNGGIIEDVVVYSAPVVKGDFMKIKTHTVNGQILMERSAANDELVNGVAVSDPAGIDGVTVSGQTPTVAYERMVDVALFGLGVIEAVVSATGAVAPGDIVGFDADERNEVETQILYAAVANGNQGLIQALTYGAAGEKVALIVGSSMVVAN